MHEIDYLLDEFIVIGCDGLFDIFSNDECIQFCRLRLADMYKFILYLLLRPLME